MNDYKVTKSQVRSNFRYAREMMRQAEAAMKANSTDFADMTSIANELIACAATFAEYVEDAREAYAEAQEEAQEEPNPYAVQIPNGAFDQDEWNAYTR